MNQIDKAAGRTDVFAAAGWLDQQWNSTARAVSPDRIEWQCTTWGSGRGRAAWEEIATFSLMVEVFGLMTSTNREGRDELIVTVPLDRFGDIAALIETLGDEAELWPWLSEEDYDRQIEIAASVLGRTVEELADDGDLLEALHIE